MDKPVPSTPASARWQLTAPTVVAARSLQRRFGATTMAITYTAVHPVRRPEGRPTPDDFTFVSGPVPELEDGQVLVENLLLSVDPYMREALEFEDWQEGFGMEGR